MKDRSILKQEQTRHHWGSFPCHPDRALGPLLSAMMLSIIMLVPASDVAAEWKLLTWVPFQVQSSLALVLSSHQSERNLAIFGVNSHLQPHEAIGKESMDLLSPPETGFFDISMPTDKYLDIIGIYPEEGIFEPFHPNIEVGKAFSIITDRDVMLQEQLKLLPSESENTGIKDGNGGSSLKFSLFSRDMKYLNRDMPERNKSRYSGWDMFMSQSPDLRRQPLMETMGKIFEPKIDLQIEF